ncbi:MAG: hypothetical protein H0W02_22320 [Ktedonobacteraceae bacterium]|nr:hypothetical protein [Ktedonobacteraceae bacterium]
MYRPEETQQYTLEEYWKLVETFHNHKYEYIDGHVRLMAGASLARTRHAIACVEEVFSSNSINAAFGIALPLLFWHALLHDQLLLLLDAPLMVILTAGALWCVYRRRVSHVGAVLFLCVYSAWVVAHLLLAR